MKKLGFVALMVATLFMAGCGGGDDKGGGDAGGDKGGDAAETK